MKPYYKLCLAALLMPLFSAAQSNYKPGYVVTSKGDTLKGYINVKEWDRNPRKITFKRSTDNNSTEEFTVKDIAFFSAQGYVTYQKYMGLLNDDPTNISNLPIGRNTSTITDTVFLKIIQKGSKIILYQYTDSKKDHFFVSDRDNRLPTELVYRVYNNDGKTVNENGYMQQLYLLAEKYNNSGALKTRIEKADYTYIDLVDIARRINNSNENDDTAVTGKKKGTFFFVSAGLNISTITSDKAFADFDPSLKTTGTTGKSSKPTSYFPRVALGINVLANPNTGRLVFRAEVSYTSNNYTGTATNSGAIEKYTLKQGLFSVIPQILYNFYNTDNFKFYGDAGMSFNFSSYTNKTVYVNPGGPTVTNSNPYGLLSRWTSFPLHAGVVLNKKCDISIAYIPNAVFTQNDSYYIQVKAIQVGLNYTFN